MNARIANKREEELTYNKKRQLLNLLNGNVKYVRTIILVAALFHTQASSFLIPVLSMLGTYATYVSKAGSSAFKALIDL